jgi:hypothetical protein
VAGGWGPQVSGVVGVVESVGGLPGLLLRQPLRSAAMIASALLMRRA